MERLTDKRFLSDGFYQPKSKEERKEIQEMSKPTYEEIYKRLGEYEDNNVSPLEVDELKMFKFSRLAEVIQFGTEVLIYEDFQNTLKIVWQGVWECNMVKKIKERDIYETEVTSVETDNGVLKVGVCYFK